MSRLNEVFSINLERFRKLAGLSQDEVAKKIGVARNTISRYESQEGSPSFDAIEKLAELFGLDETTLVTDPELISLWEKMTEKVEAEINETLGRMEAEAKGIEYVPKEIIKPAPSGRSGIHNTQPYWPKLIKGSAPILAGRKAEDKLSPVLGPRKALLDLIATIPDDRLPLILDTVKTLVKAAANKNKTTSSGTE